MGAMNKKFLGVLAVIAIILYPGFWVYASDYPTKPVTLISPTRREARRT